MIVLCMCRATNPHEVELAIGGGAGSVEIVTASVLLREEGEHTRQSPYAPVEGRGETGQIQLPDDFEIEAAEGDVVVTVTWPGGVEAEPLLDCCYCKPPTGFQLLTMALALEEYARFPIWEARMDVRLKRQAEELAAMRANVEAEEERLRREAEAGRRVAAAMVGEARGPVDLSQFRKGR